MADKKISDLTAVTTVGDSDLFEMENSGGNSRKVTGANLKASMGVALISTSSPTGTGVVSFTSIPATFKHLQVRISGRSTGAVTSANANVQFNSDTGANYDQQVNAGSGSTANATATMGGTSFAGALITGASGTAGYAGHGILDIFNYTDTNLNKTCHVLAGFQSGTASGNITNWSGTMGWRSTAAITRIDITLSSGNWAAGSIVSLYGIN